MTTGATSRQPPRGSSHVYTSADTRRVASIRRRWPLNMGPHADGRTDAIGAHCSCHEVSPLAPMSTRLQAGAHRCEGSDGRGGEQGHQVGNRRTVEGGMLHIDHDEIQPGYLHHARQTTGRNLLTCGPPTLAHVEPSVRPASPMP